MRLIALTRELAADLAGGEFSRARFRNVSEIAANLREVSKAYQELYVRKEPAPPWIGYFAEDESSGAVVGSCGYKDACRDGAVEIAYFSFPGYEGRGHATAMARALVDLALDSPEVKLILAHTLPEENASVRILRRLGFAWLGMVDDPEDGPVWRWELKRA